MHYCQWEVGTVKYDHGNIEENLMFTEQEHCNHEECPENDIALP